MIALLIGRWQPFHKGHKYLINKAREDFERIVIGVGSSQKSRTPENPLSYEEREVTIKSCYPQIEVFPVQDMGDDKLWIKEVEKGLKKLDIKNSKENVVSVGMNKWTQDCFRKAGYQTKGYKQLKPEKYNATTLRKLVAQERGWENLIPGCALKKIKKFNLKEILSEVGEP